MSDETLLPLKTRQTRRTESTFNVLMNVPVLKSEQFLSNRSYIRYEDAEV